LTSSLAALDRLQGLMTPSVRLGVTGLARSGKTVFITALVRNMLEGGRLPFFSAAAEARIVRAYLEPQPDDDVPRFDYEAHLATLGAEPPAWPESTRRISELRITIEYRPLGLLRRRLGGGRLHVDIVDYPGEWLIDLAMLEQSYGEWSAAALRLARAPGRAGPAAPWLERLAGLDPAAPQSEQVAAEAAGLFTGYLAAARAAEPGLSTLGPGRFLMPGDLAGSPLLTFVPLDLAPGAAARKGTLAAMMARRYESYRTRVVMPFFRDHFARLDRQIVLVDALSSLNAGPAATAELATVLEACLLAFRPGRASWLANLAGWRNIDRILIAASKADQIHHSSHDRLEEIVRALTESSRRRAADRGADVKVLALAALRATREAEMRQDGELLPCIIGVPLAGQAVAGRVFDGRREAAIFPGDLPADPASLITPPAAGTPSPRLDLQLPSFGPPRLARIGATAPWPHVRLDRALEFLIGDRLA
jgi:hypothetical protein